jgi:hypothetical protein
MAGDEMAVKLFIMEDDICAGKDIFGKEIKIAVPPVVKANEVYRTCVSLVIAVGPDCFKGERYKNSGPWCRVGDWVFMPRNEGLQVVHRGIPMHYIKHDKIYCIIEDPSYIYRK